MTWSERDPATKAGLIAGGCAVILLVLPPLSIVAAVIAIVFSAVGWRRSIGRGQPDLVARNCLIASAALVALIVVGSAVYAALA